MIRITNELNDLISWINEYFDENEIEKAIIGVSGGIDSAVMTSLLNRALGNRRIIPVLLPCESEKQDQIDAKRLCDRFHMDPLVYDLEKTFDAFREETNEKTQPLNMVARGNIKARLRMLTLYDIANRIGNSLVVGTTNKTEAMIGYATKYGDGGVDIEPLQDFHKSEIYELAELLGDIPIEIIEKSPSAGLWEGQTDEKELGMSYAEIEKSLEIIIRLNEESLIIKENEIVRKVYSMVKKNRHKSLHPPYFYRKEIY